VVTLEEVTQNEALRHQEFPVTAEQIFMAHAGVSPLPRCAAEGIREFLDTATRHAQENARVVLRLQQTREVAAQLLNAQPDEISLIGPTSLGLSLVAAGLTWREGDEVVYYPDDYPANVYPWAALRAKGVNPVPLQPEDYGVITWSTVKRALSARTRLVALASCHYLSGHRIPLAVIGQELHKRGILFCVDGIQSVGAFPTPVDGVDFLSADSHKWMLGPCGAGIFYVSARTRDQLNPILLGAGNVHSPDFLAQDTLEFPHSYRKYEPGAPNLVGLCGMRAAMCLLQAWGIERIAERLLQLRRHLVEHLHRLGFVLFPERWNERTRIQVNAERIENDGDAWNPSAIVSAYHPNKDMEALFESLREARIIVSLRKTRMNRLVLRFSPHAYNTEDEIDAVADVLSKA
jgi:selenocysteine lyase/cysteine desulfurase